MQDSVEGDPCKFVLWSRGSAERFTLQASSASIKMTWVDTIAILLDAQNNFLSGLGMVKAQLTPSASVAERLNVTEIL